MSVEKWLPVPGFEGLYEVSSHGRVQKIAPWCDGVNHYATRLLPVDRAWSGHFRVNLTRPGRWQKAKSVHRLVMHAFARPPKPGEVVNHKDGDPGNNRFENLEYTTVQGNTLHAIRVLGRSTGKKGSKHPHAKLDESEVLEIIERLKQGEEHLHIAKDFGICYGTISNIARNSTWKHLSREAMPDRRFNYCQPGSAVQIPPNQRPKGSKLSQLKS